MKTLVLLEQEALNSLKKQNYGHAIKLFKKLINKQPDFEHGTPYYNLACCYEDIGELEKARISFKKALSFNSRDLVFLGGYASFLYQYGTPVDALSVYRRLLKATGNSSQSEQQILPIIMELKKKIINTNKRGSHLDK